MRAHRLQTGRWSSALPSVIEAAARDKAIAELQTLQHTAMMSVFADPRLSARRRLQVFAKRAGGLQEMRWRATPVPCISQ
jgi:hypothetical protein